MLWVLCDSLMLLLLCSDVSQRKLISVECRLTMHCASSSHIFECRLVNVYFYRVWCWLWHCDDEFVNFASPFVWHLNTISVPLLSIVWATVTLCFWFVCLCMYACGCQVEVFSNRLAVDFWVHCDVVLICFRWILFSISNKHFSDLIALGHAVWMSVVCNRWIPQIEYTIC